jgi:hypothetical protein
VKFTFCKPNRKKEKEEMGGDAVSNIVLEMGKNVASERSKVMPRLTFWKR